MPEHGSQFLGFLQVRPSADRTDTAEGTCSPLSQQTDSRRSETSCHHSFSCPCTCTEMAQAVVVPAGTTANALSAGKHSGFHFVLLLANIAIGQCNPVLFVQSAD